MPTYNISPMINHRAYIRRWRPDRQGDEICRFFFFLSRLLPCYLSIRQDRSQRRQAGIRRLHPARSAGERRKKGEGTHGQESTHEQRDTHKEAPKGHHIRKTRIVIRIIFLCASCTFCDILGKDFLKSSIQEAVT